MKGLLAPKDPYTSVNPKDILASTKLDLSLVPETMELDTALAFLEGALKYGRYNWRAKPVKMSVYISALKRHLKKLEAGEDHDRSTGVKHIGYILCCAAIINDAGYYGTLVDDRPPRGPNNPDMSKVIDGASKTIRRLNAIFKGLNPKQYTINDITPKPSRAKRSNRRKIRQASYPSTVS